MKERTPFIQRLIEEEFLTPGWHEFSDAFEHVEFILNTVATREEMSHPAGKKIFRALNECKPEDLKVVILGQDPYYDGSATGLAFDNYYASGKNFSPSLSNIRKELESDLEEEYIKKLLLTEFRSDSVLGHLPSQGVLLLNTALTVKHKLAGSHLRLWKPFTEQLIKDINKLDNIVWILWGNHAKSYKSLIENKTHHIIEGGHPSPLNTTVSFAGGKYFSKANEILQSINKDPIQW